MVYMSDKKAVKLFNECMDELYRASTPSIGWDEIKKKYSGKPRNEFYLRHCIEQDVYDRIVSRYKKMLTVYYRRKFDWFLLDFSPTICKDELL